MKDYEFADDTTKQVLLGSLVDDLTDVKKVILSSSQMWEDVQYFRNFFPNFKPVLVLGGLFQQYQKTVADYVASLAELQGFYCEWQFLPKPLQTFSQLLLCSG